jgi:hypothetical protein
MDAPLCKVWPSEVFSFSFNSVLQKIYLAIAAAQLSFLPYLLAV